MQGVHDAVFPAADLKVPAGQSEQAPSTVSAVAPAFANLPAGHKFAVNVEHEEDPAREYEPEEQVLVHAKLSLICPVFAPNLPEAHRVQDV